MTTTPRLARFVGGPLDGHEVDVSDWTADAIRTGVLHVVPGWFGRPRVLNGPHTVLCGPLLVSSRSY